MVEISTASRQNAKYEHNILKYFVLLWISGDNLFFAAYHGATCLYKQIMMKALYHIQSIFLRSKRIFIYEPMMMMTHIRARRWATVLGRKVAVIATRCRCPRVATSGQSWACCWCHCCWRGWWRRWRKPWWKGTWCPPHPPGECCQVQLEQGQPGPSGQGFPSRH